MDKPWKVWERKVCSFFGGKRRGPLTRRVAGGFTDCIDTNYAIECKYTSNPITWGLIKGALAQLEGSADLNDRPMVVAISQKRQKFAHGLVVMMWQDAVREYPDVTARAVEIRARRPRLASIRNKLKSGTSYRIITDELDILATTFGQII